MEKLNVSGALNLLYETRIACVDCFGNMLDIFFCSIFLFVFFFKKKPVAWYCNYREKLRVESYKRFCFNSIDKKRKKTKGCCSTSP